MGHTALHKTVEVNDCFYSLWSHNISSLKTVSSSSAEEFEAEARSGVCTSEIKPLLLSALISGCFACEMFSVSFSTWLIF